jgi:hypothetical protein
MQAFLQSSNSRYIPQKERDLRTASIVIQFGITFGG